MPRSTLDSELTAKAHTFSCYDEEWQALERMTIALRLRVPFDIVRLLISQSSNKEVKVAAGKSFRSPRSATKRTLIRRLL